MGPRPMKRLVILILVIACGVALFTVIDIPSMTRALLDMPRDAAITLALLLFGSEILKGLRWTFFLHASHLSIRSVDGLTSYLGAQAATALPGGSVLTARLAQEHGQVQMHQAAAGLVGQGIADIFALALVAACAILVTRQQPIQMAIPAAALVAAACAVVVVRSRRLAAWLVGLLGRFRLTRRFLPQEEDFWAHAMVLMTPRTLLTGAVYSVVITGISALVLLTLTGALTDRGLRPGEALYAHGLSTVARLIVPVPGGFGVSDGSLTGLLNYIGIGFGRATFIALAYRSIGLLFRSVMGVLVLAVRYPYLLVGSRRVRLGRQAASHPGSTGAPVEERTTADVARSAAPPR